MCNICNQKKCCCKPKRLNVRGKQGDQGRPGTNGINGTNGTNGTNGVSAYVYIAYASNVVSGTPDTVTGFSLTTPNCWLAIITNTTPLTPIQADFQGKWKKVCGDSASGIYLRATSPSPFVINSGNSNINQDVSPGDSLTVVTGGVYFITSRLNFVNHIFASSSGLAGNVEWKIKVNSTTVGSSTYSLNDFTGSFEFTPTVSVVATVNPGDTISSFIRLSSPQAGEQLFSVLPQFDMIAFKIV